MQDIFGSVRRSLVFRAPPDADDSPVTLVDKISVSIRKSRVFSKPSPPPSIPKDAAPPIGWRKGELIGCGTFGRVYICMNLDSGELLAVKQKLHKMEDPKKPKVQIRSSLRGFCNIMGELHKKLPPKTVKTLQKTPFGSFMKSTTTI